MLRRTLLIAVAALAVMAVMPAAGASHDNQTTKERSTWWWDGGSRTGRSVLTRGQGGLEASYGGEGLTPGDAVTLWFIIFNNPEGCATSPCSIPADVFNPDARADFHWGDGRVVGPSGNAMFNGSLPVGQTTTSGKVETGLGEAVALDDPRGAEVVLALHSHGPALTGSDLVAQLTSFTGGCMVFNGPDGFAGGPADLPDAVGECSTIQRSVHR